MYVVCSGQKVKNVGGRTYYSEETLPLDYKPPISFIEQKIVKEVKNGSKNRKTR